jgi:protein-tyrosine-phosphatase
MVVSVMAEIGIDLKNQQPQLLSSSMIENSKKTINMGCVDKESCPSLFVKSVDDWNVEDPKGKSIDDVRKIRDQIKNDVLNLLDSLENDV